MPTSATEGKQFIKDWADKQTDIKTILDIGVGEGIYRKLLGDKYYWIGVEAFPAYISWYGLNKIYNKLITGDARKLELPDADLIICGDVLEHMTYDEVVEFIEKCDKFKHMVISIPLGYSPQESINGNIYESHLSCWNMELAGGVFDFPIKRKEGEMGVFVR